MDNTTTKGSSSAVHIIQVCFLDLGVSATGTP